MADKYAKKKDGANETGSKKKGRLKTGLLVLGLMIGEGVGIFALLAVFNQTPESTLAAEDAAAADDPLNINAYAEQVLCEVDAFNRKEGNLYVYHIEVSALVATDDLEKVQRFIEARDLSIRDRIQVVIRAADPQDLNDPKLEAVKRQIRFELNNLMGGKELIHEILISKLLQSRTHL